MGMGAGVGGGKPLYELCQALSQCSQKAIVFVSGCSVISYHGDHPKGQHHIALTHHMYTYTQWGHGSMVVQPTESRK